MSVHRKILTAIILLWPLYVTAQPDVLRQQLQTRLDSIYATGQFPGATVGVALSDGTSFGLATGLADRETGSLMQPSDKLMQGSVGKTYVAAIALQLVEEGILTLDNKIGDYLGEKSWFERLPNAHDITVRMLMNHTSGLVRYEFNPSFMNDLSNQPDRVWQPEELVAYILDSDPPFPAGENWIYSDTNYIVLGIILEHLTGKKYLDLLRDRLLSPFDLRQTFPSDARILPGLVQGYAGENNPFGNADEVITEGQFVINPQFEWTGGGIYSTSEDLAKWARILYEGKVFDQTLLDEMLVSVPAPLGPSAQYGLGVIIRPTELGISYGHSGFFPGYLTEVMYFPGSRISVALQVNTSVMQHLGGRMDLFCVDLAKIITEELQP